MYNDKILLNKLERLLIGKRGKKFYSKKLNIPITEVTRLLKIVRKKNKALSNVLNAPLNITRKVNVKEGTVESTATTTFDPKDHTALAKLHKVDLTKYVITNYWSKVLPNGKFTSSVFSKRKTK